MTRCPGVKTVGPTLGYLLNKVVIVGSPIATPAFYILLLLAFLGGGCSFAVTRPKLEMSLAASALMAAKEADASQWTPSLYKKAEYYYLKAKSAYRRKYFNKAKQYAKLATNYSEKAEFVSAIKKAIQ